MTIHEHPRPWLYRVSARLLAVVLILGGWAIIAQIGLGFTVGPLFFGTAFFTAVLMIPLLLQSVLHPTIIVRDDGLTLRPMLWPEQFVRWDQLTGIIAHPLIFNDEASGQHLHGQKYQPREGVVILVDPQAGLSSIYRLVGGVAGMGNTPAFAISSTTHTGYTELLAAIRADVPDRSV
jgi:hypothetical protein